MRRNSKKRKQTRKKLSRTLKKSKSRTWAEEVRKRISSRKSNLKANEVLGRKRNRVTIEQQHEQERRKVSSDLRRDRGLRIKQQSSNEVHQQHRSAGHFFTVQSTN